MSHKRKFEAYTPPPFYPTQKKNWIPSLGANIKISFDILRLNFHHRHVEIFMENKMNKLNKVAQ